MSAVSFYFYLNCCELSKSIFTNIQSCGSSKEIYNTFHNITQNNKISFNCFSTLELDESEPLRQFGGSIMSENNVDIDYCYFLLTNGYYSWHDNCDLSFRSVTIKTDINTKSSDIPELRLKSQKLFELQWQMYDKCDLVNDIIVQFKDWLRYVCFA